MIGEINKRKVSAIIRSFDKWILEHTTLPLPTRKNANNELLPYHRWYVGITKFKNGERLKQHIAEKKVSGIYYKQLEAGTKIQANLVERHFSNLGTMNAPHAGGAKEDSTTVYIFKIKPNILDNVMKILNN